MDNNPQRVSQKIASKIELIESLIEQKKFSQALAEIRDLESQHCIDDFSILRGHIYYLLSVTFRYLGRYEEGLKEGRKAFDLLKNTIDNEKIAQIQFVLGNIYVARGDFEKAESEMRDALATYRRIENKKGTITVYSKLANICFINSDFDKAIKYLNQAIGYCNESGDETTKAALAANLIRIYILVGRWQSAQESLISAVKVFEEKDNELYLCQAYLSLGYVSYLQRDFKKANKYYEQANKLISENGYAREYAIYHEYAGELEFAQGHYDKAENLYLTCIGNMEMLAPEGDMISQTYRLLAELQIAEKRYDEALTSCEKALKVAESLGEKIEIGAIHRALGCIYTKLKQNEKAKENFEKSISILQEIGAKFELGKAYLEALRSSAFEYVDRTVYYGNARDIFQDLESDYWLGKTSSALCEMFLEYGEYGKADVYLKENKGLESVAELRGKIDRALGRISSPDAPNRTVYLFSDIITQDQKMIELIKEARRYKDTDVPILIEGETGTGKDLLAMAIHCESKRKNKPFVSVNCPALSEHLMESELFGHKKGAFTGADQERIGLVESANGGILFLNEIGDFPLRLQAKILDLIENKRLTRVGENKSRNLDFRVIAATNKNLQEEMKRENFREDLYHRLNTVRLKLPPLRERKGDIPILIEHFLSQSHAQIDTYDLDFQPCLEYHWPGNVRELENESRKYGSVSEFIEGMRKWEKGKTKNKVGKLREMEKAEILEAIRTTQDKNQAAELLGISLSTLYRKMNFYKIEIK